MRKRKYKKHFIPKEQLQAILREAKHLCPEVAPFFLGVYETGLRSYTLLNLTWNDIDFQRRSILIPNYTREISIPRAFWNYLLNARR